MPATVLRPALQEAAPFFARTERPRGRDDAARDELRDRASNVAPFDGPRGAYPSRVCAYVNVHVGWPRRALIARA